MSKGQISINRIRTGTTKLISINTLYKETGWDTLKMRRKNHKLTLFFKMSTNISPPYLSSLAPQSVDHASSYNLGNSHNLRPIATRTNLYYYSFLPSVIRDWNELPVVVRQLDYVCSFKNFLKGDFTTVPKSIVQAIGNNRSYTHVYEQTVAH